MKYFGGKFRSGQEISDVIKKLTPNTYKIYLEPFCGAISIIINMTDTYECYASDYHPDLICMWKELQNDTFIPPAEVSEDDYNKIKLYKSPNAIKGFVGFGCSFGGKFFSGYAQKYTNGKNENYLKAATNSIRKLKPKIKNIHFDIKCYKEYNPVNKVIYCDPPYESTTFPIKYRRDTKKYDEFDNTEFWNIMRQWSQHNLVFISEVRAPDDFICVWSKEAHRSASQSNKTRYKNEETDKYKTEKLFIHEFNINNVNTL